MINRCFLKNRTQCCLWISFFRNGTIRHYGICFFHSTCVLRRIHYDTQRSISLLLRHPQDDRLCDGGSGHGAHHRERGVVVKEEVKRHPGRHRAWAVQGSRARVCASEHAQQKRPVPMCLGGSPRLTGPFPPAPRGRGC